MWDGGLPAQHRRGKGVSGKIFSGVPDGSRKTIDAIVKGISAACHQGCDKNCRPLEAAWTESGRGQPQSKTLRVSRTLWKARQVLDCGCPLPPSLSPGCPTHLIAPFQQA